MLWPSGKSLYYVDCMHFIETWDCFFENWFIVKFGECSRCRRTTHNSCEVLFAHLVCSISFWEGAFIVCQLVLYLPEVIFYTHTCARAHVIKYRFYHYLGMERPTDLEMTVIEKTVCYTYRLQKKGVHHAVCRGGRHAGKHESHSRGRKREKKMWARPLCGFCGKEWVKQVK